MIFLNAILPPYRSTATGLANLRIMCQILRIPRALLNERLDEIIAFSGVGELMQKKVSSYHAGTYERLAASAALHLDPDIVLVDGTLPLGDTGYRDKIQTKLCSLVQNGATLLYAGQGLADLQAQCRRAIWLEDGRVHADGPADDLIREANMCKPAPLKGAVAGTSHRGTESPAFLNSSARPSL